MTLLLSSQNIFEYLVRQNICRWENKSSIQPELKPAKNFNLLLSLQDSRQIFVKQERHNYEGKTANEFLNEWQIHKLFQQFSKLNSISPWLSEVLNFDADNSIIIFNYLSNYRDLTDLYTRENIFPAEIAGVVGRILATIHRATFDRQDYRDFLVQNHENTPLNSVLNFTQSLGRISPEIFGLVPADSLRFFALYQRYDSLSHAISELISTFQPCCLTHNDLKLNNILIHHNWKQSLSKTERSQDSAIRLIDWERGGWGDPAFDLGTLIASYIQIWLGSLVVSKKVPLEDALRLATTPIELLQPSMAALVQAYFQNFPEIVEHRPDFLKRVVQYTGLAAIEQIQAMIQYQKSFGNAGICMLQVAKSLLCRPEQSISTVFGVAESELTPFSHSLA